MKTIEEVFVENHVDEEKLIRNYRINPIKIIPRNKSGGIMKEMFEKQDAYYLYIELNMAREDLSIVFNRSESNLIKTLRDIGIKKDGKKIKENTAKSLLKKEGITNVFQRESVKKKTKETNLEKYGKEYYSKTEEYCKRIKETKFQRYGNPNYNNIEKVKETNIKKYGVSNHERRNYTSFQLDVLENDDKLLEYIIKNGIINIKNLSESLKIRYRTIWKIINKNNWYYLFDYSRSKEEREIAEYISQFYDIEINTRKYLNGKEIDIYIPEKKIGIEFNGDYWHTELQKSKSYHYEKSKLANEQGIFIYHIFEYEWNRNRDEIISNLNWLLNINQTNISSNDCEIKVNENDGVNIELYHQDEMIYLMIFVKESDWILANIYRKNDYTIENDNQMVLDYFINNYKPSSIIAKSSIAKERDEDFKKMGFKIIGYEEPEYVWFKSGQIIESKNDEEMIEKGFVRIYDCGKNIWKYENNLLTNT